MACQRFALCLLFLLAGHEVLAARQKMQQMANVQGFNGLFKYTQDEYEMNGEHGSTRGEGSLSLKTAAACDKDIIVESSDGSKAPVSAHAYRKLGVEVLKKHSEDCTYTYSVICSMGESAIRKDSTCGVSEERRFNAFHWWRTTTITPSKGETSITFSDALGLPRMTFGKVTFTPSGTSCSAASASMQSQASQMESILKQDIITDFKNVFWVLKEYVNTKHEMIAMGCPAEFVEENENKIIEGTRAYFNKHETGNADKHFIAALDRIKSVQNHPTEKDFVEVAALMRMGACPEEKETRQSVDSMTHLVEEVKESEEEQVVEYLQNCFETEDCIATRTERPNPTSLMQKSLSAVREAELVLFICLLILCAIVWPMVLIILIIWLLAFSLIN